MTNHRLPASAGQNGPIVVTLKAPDENGLSSGCVKAKGALNKDDTANPNDYYLNVHNSDFTGGALRASSPQKARSLSVLLGRDDKTKTP
jgi:hypothetical protein